jgi:hypothetical protein
MLVNSRHHFSLNNNLDALIGLVHSGGFQSNNPTPAIPCVSHFQNESSTSERTQRSHRSLTLLEGRRSSAKHCGCGHVLLVFEKRQRPFFQVEKHVGIYIGVPEIMSLDAMLSKPGEALFDLDFTEVGHFEAPVAIRCTAAEAAFHTRSLAFESRPSVKFEKCPELWTTRSINGSASKRCRGRATYRTTRCSKPIIVLTEISTRS